MKYAEELKALGLYTWDEQIGELAKRYVQDPEDRSLLTPTTFDLDAQFDVSTMEPEDGMYGDYVKTNDFMALAERFVLAWELIKETESEEEYDKSAKAAYKRGFSDAMSSNYERINEILGLAKTQKEEI